ncbi:MAG: mechanosensitive ion channel, partial [Arenicellales bacterium]|nr:mechanosensitive ion channel [Arenicellales bacterium]
MIPHGLNLRLIAFWLSLAALVLPAYGPGTALAQSGDDAAAPSVPTELTKEQVDDMVARLSDTEVRQLLIQQLERVASPEEKPLEKKAAIERFVNTLGRAETNIEATIAGMSELPHLPVELWRRISEGSTSSTWSILFKLILFFVIGLVVEQVFRRLVINIGKPDIPKERLLFAVRFKLSFFRALMDILAIIVFTVATVIAWLILELPTENADFLFTTVLSATIFWRLVAAGLRLVLAPKLSWLRLANLGDAQAQRIYTKLLVLTGLVAFLMESVGEVILRFGFSLSARGAVGLITSAIFIGTIVFYIWQIRPTQTDTSVGGESKDYISRNWHVLAIIGVLFIYAFALGVNFATGTRVLNQAIASLVLLGFIPVVDVGLRGWVSRFMGATEEKGDAPGTVEKVEGETEASPMIENVIAEQPPSETVQQKLPEKEQSYEGVIVTNLRILLFLFAVLIFAEIWDLNLFGFLEAMVGERTARVLVNFSITALLAYAVWGVVSTAVARVAGPEPQQAGLPGDEGGGAGGSRLGTVLPLFRKFLFITLMVMLIMILLSSLGVDIGPLIAGAGILGIAIGFGAQTLIKDIVSG